MRLYNGKWHGIWDRNKYQIIRNKICETFNELVFEEGPHKYYLHGKEMTCVSNVTHLFQEHFDVETKAKETYERNFDNPESNYYKMTIEEIINNWDENSKQACQHGTERHEFGESCFYFMTEQYDKILPNFKNRVKKDENNKYYFESLYPKEDAIVRYWTDLPQSIVPILAETKVYDTELGYSGTFDILFYYDATLDGKDDSKSGLYIMDYKSNKDLYKNFKEKTLLYPFEELLDMPVSLYKLQLSLYQNPLMKLGFKIVARALIWVLPSGNYNKVRLEEYVEILRKELKIRNKELKIT